MVINLNNCDGCLECVVACKGLHKTSEGAHWLYVMAYQQGDDAEDDTNFLVRPCMHCDEAPCEKVCPVGARHTREEDGLVLSDYEICIGCRYCMIACPYGARYFDFGENYDDEVEGSGLITSPEYGMQRGGREPGKSPIGNVRKCSFCYHRLERGEEPACVETCIGDARNAGDLNDPDSEVAELAHSPRAFQLKEEEGTDPNVYYLK